MPTLQWNSVAGITEYRVQVRDAADAIIDEEVVQTTSHTVAAGLLATGTTYRWRIRSINQYGMEGPWSVEWSFTAYKPAIASPVSPVDGSSDPDGTITFTWNGQYADSYDLEVAEDAGFASPIVQQNRTQTSYTTALTVGRTYYWRVRGNGPLGQGVWSSVWTVVIPQPCATATESGGEGTTQTNHGLGSVPGTVHVDYEMFGVKDAMNIYYDGQVVASTNGPVANTGRLSFYYTAEAGKPQYCMVEVIGPTGTGWNYTLNCPA